MVEITLVNNIKNPSRVKEYLEQKTKGKVNYYLKTNRETVFEVEDYKSFGFEEITKHLEDNHDANIVKISQVERDIVFYRVDGETLYNQFEEGLEDENI